MLETIHLALPATTDDLRKLKIGTVAYLSGRIFTAREGAYKHAIEEGAAYGAAMSAGKKASGMLATAFSSMGSTRVTVRDR